MFIHTYSLQEIIVSFRRSAPISYLAQDIVLAGYGLSDFRLFLDWSKGYFSFHRLVPTGSKAHPASYKMRHFPKSKHPKNESSLSPAYGAKVKNA